MNYNEIITLRYLGDGKNHTNGPKEISHEQFCTACRALKGYDMIRAAFIEGGDLAAAVIKKSGIAALQDLNRLENQYLKSLLKNKGITRDQYLLLQHAKHYDEISNIFDCDDDEYKEVIWKPLYQCKYLKSKEIENGGFTVTISRSGLQLVEEIEEELIEMFSNGGKVVSEPSTQSNNLLEDLERVKNELETYKRLYNEDKNKIRPKNVPEKFSIRCSERQTSSLIKVLYGLIKEQILVNEDGSPLTMKDGMAQMGAILMNNKIINYSSSLSESTKASSDTYYNVFDTLKGHLENYRNNHTEKMMDKKKS